MTAPLTLGFLAQWYSVVKLVLKVLVHQQERPIFQRNVNDNRLICGNKIERIKKAKPELFDPDNSIPARLVLLHHI